MMWRKCCNCKFTTNARVAMACPNCGGKLVETSQKQEADSSQTEKGCYFTRNPGNVNFSNL